MYLVEKYFSLWPNIFLAYNFFPSRSHHGSFKGASYNGLFEYPEGWIYYHLSNQKLRIWLQIWNECIKRSSEYRNFSIHEVIWWKEKFVLEPLICVKTSPISLDSKQRRNSQFEVTNFMKTADRKNCENTKEKWL